MKKIFLTLIILGLAQSAFAVSDRTAAVKQMDTSYYNLREKCYKIAKNFHYDAQFSGYMRNQCMLYETDRQRLLPLMYPQTTKNGTNYTNNYQVLMAQYAVQLDNERLKYYKDLTEKYCENNQFRYVKKDPQACERAKSLF